MFSQNFIEKVYKQVSENSEVSSYTVQYGPMNFLVTKIPLEKENQAIFQGCIGEGNSLLFVYLQ